MKGLAGSRSGPFKETSSVFRIARREVFGPATFLWEVEAPRVARAARPGHFVMLRVDEAGERIPLTIADYDVAAGTVTLVVQAVGKTTRQMMAMPEGATILDFVGPLGVPSHIENRGTVVCVGGGLGVAPVFPILRAFKQAGCRTRAIIGFRGRDLMFWHDRFSAWADELVITTDDGSFGEKGLVIDPLRQLLEAGEQPGEVFAVGPIPMMRATAETTRPFGVRTTVSLNSIMVDGTGMCGSCRVTVDGVMRFACVDGPDFDGHAVNFDEMSLRQKRFEREEREAAARYQAEAQALAALAAPCASPEVSDSVQRARGTVLPFPKLSRAAAPRPAAPWREECGIASPQTLERMEVESSARLADPHSRGIADTAGVTRATQHSSRHDVPVPVTAAPVVRTIRTIAGKQTRMPEQDAAARAHNFLEVNLGFSLEQAWGEADRCLQCRKARCVPGCPVGIDIPGFIGALRRHDLRESYRILKRASALPAVCGRVCPQESQCEATCIVGRKLEPVGIGRLERFVADFALSQGWDDEIAAAPTGRRVAIVGSGPAGLACAGDLVRNGVAVTVFEGLHVPGGVLQYGIPEFRLPRHIIHGEIEALARAGVVFELDALIGNLFTVPELLSGQGFHAVFIGTGAGSPKFMGIPGESLNGVFSANEFLTRVNLMRGHDKPIYDTPVGMGRRVAVIGSGNTAMDAARVAIRVGAERVSIVYRRTERESPARVEERRHAAEEGVEFLWLTNPTRILGSPSGWVSGIEVVTMELGEPDESGRRRPRPLPGTERVLDVDTVISALGTTANPILARTTPGLKVNRWGYIEVDPETNATSLPGVFAGGDIVTGAATVILAMGAGRRAAAGILDFLGVRPAAAAATA